MDSQSPVEKVAKSVVVGIICIICIVGNILVFRALIFSKYPRIPIYIVIGGVAAADLLKIVIETTNYFIDMLKTDENGLMTDAWCKAQYYLSSVASYVVAAHLVIFSIIRCIMLNDRVHSRSYVKHTLIGCIIIWIGICCSNTLNLKAVEMIEQGACVESNSKVSAEDERNLWLRFSFSYIIPLVIVIVVYIMTKVLSMRFFEESYSSRERRFSRMVTMLVVTFAVFNLPYDVIYLMMFYHSRKYIEALADMSVTESEFDQLMTQMKTYFDIEDYCKIVSFIDLVLRPIIYAKFSYYFGNSFDEVINCDSCQGNGRRRKRRKTDSGMSTQEPLAANEEEVDANDEGDTIINQNHLETKAIISSCPITIFINDDKEGMFIGSICDEQNGTISGVRLESDDV